MRQNYETNFNLKKKRRVYNMFKIFSTYIFLNKYIKCNVQRLAVRYDLIWVVRRRRVYHGSRWGDQLHAPPIYLLPVPTEKEAGQAPEQVRTFRRVENCDMFAGHDTAHWFTLITTLTAPSGDTGVLLLSHLDLSDVQMSTVSVNTASRTE